MATVNVRNMVHVVETAINSYTKHFGFQLVSSAAPASPHAGAPNDRVVYLGEKRPN